MVNWWELCSLLLIWTPCSQRGRSALEVFLGNCGVHLVFYAIFYFYPNAENEHSSAQFKNYSFCHFSALLWKHLLPSLTSTLQSCTLLAGVWVDLHCSSGGILAPWALILFSHKDICNGWMTFLDSTHCHFHLSLSSNPINWATQAESNIHCVTKEKPLLEWLSSKK